MPSYAFDHQDVYSTTNTPGPYRDAKLTQNLRVGDPGSNREQRTVNVTTKEGHRSKPRREGSERLAILLRNPSKRQLYHPERQYRDRAGAQPRFEKPDMERPKKKEDKLQDLIKQLIGTKFNVQQRDPIFVKQETKIKEKDPSLTPAEVEQKATVDLARKPTVKNVTMTALDIFTKLPQWSQRTIFSRLSPPERNILSDLYRDLVRFYPNIPIDFTNGIPNNYSPAMITELPDTPVNLQDAELNMDEEIKVMEEEKVADETVVPRPVLSNYTIPNVEIKQALTMILNGASDATMIAKRIWDYVNVTIPKMMPADKLKFQKDVFGMLANIVSSDQFRNIMNVFRPEYRQSVVTIEDEEPDEEKHNTTYPPVYPNLQAPIQQPQPVDDDQPLTFGPVSNIAEELKDLSRTFMNSEMKAPEAMDGTIRQFQDVLRRFEVLMEQKGFFNNSKKKGVRIGGYTLKDYTHRPDTTSASGRKITEDKWRKLIQTNMWNWIQLAEEFYRQTGMGLAVEKKKESWISLVKRVSREENISYKEALTVAS